MTNYPGNNYVDQYRDVKLFYKKYVREQLLPPIIKYDKVKPYYPVQRFDLRFQVDYVTPKKIGLFEDYDENPVNTDFYVILFNHKRN